MYVIVIVIVGIHIKNNQLNVATLIAQYEQRPNWSTKIL